MNIPFRSLEPENFLVLPGDGAAILVLLGQNGSVLLTRQLDPKAWLAERYLLESTLSGEKIQSYAAVCDEEVYVAFSSSLSPSIQSRSDES